MTTTLTDTMNCERLDVLTLHDGIGMFSTSVMN